MTALPRQEPAQYVYLAARPDGRRTMGLRRARDPRHLTEQLRRDRLVPLRTWTLPAWAPGGGGRVSLKDQAELHTQLAQLLTRSVPLVEALDVTATAVAPRTRPRVERMRDLVASGASFADAATAVALFDRVTISVYRASERTGDLGGAARQLSITVRRQLAISGKVGTLLIYPVIVLTISVVVTVFMLTFIVPRIGQALESGGMVLPWFTKAMMGTGIFLRGNALLSTGVVLALVAGGVFARKPIGVGLGRLARRLPLLREVLLAQESARFFTVMAAMTKSGITLADALGVAVEALGHPTLRRQIAGLRKSLIEGGVLRQLIDSVDALPVPTRRLLIAAERAGDLESAFDTLAGDLTEELDRRTTRLLAALEPLLIVAMFLMIGSLLLSIMIPLMKSASQVGL